MKNDPPSFKIAILGAGFAGLSFASFASSSYPQFTFHVFDPIEVSKRASARAFLLHPYIHPKSILNWKGHEAFQEAETLIHKAQEKTKINFFVQRPFLKLVNHPKLIPSFKKASELYEDVSWEEKTSYQASGLWIKKAYQIEAKAYLNALQKLCEDQGVQFFNKKLSSYQEYDLILYASGYETKKLLPDLFSSYTPIKGQTITLKCPSSLKLNHAISAYKCHLVPSFDQKTLLLASTYERGFKDTYADIETAVEYLLPKLNFLPYMWTRSDVLEVHSGIRFYAPDKMPKLGKINKKTWVITGLGSKGLLYHAYLGKMLVQHIFEDQTSQIPEKLQFTTEASQILDKVH